MSTNTPLKGVCARININRRVTSHSSSIKRIKAMRIVVKITIEAVWAGEDFEGMELSPRTLSVLKYHNLTRALLSTMSRDELLKFPEVGKKMAEELLRSGLLKQS